MPTIDCSLVSEGSSDAALLPLIRWTVAQHASPCPVEVVWADLRHSRKPARTLAEKIAEAVALYPCNILFVHRDADRAPPDWRRSEIAEAVDRAREHGLRVPHVCVIPVRMQEAWLLLDPVAIRRAVGNPNGRDALDMPPTTRIEEIPDPKRVLYDLLKTACGLHGRRLRAFDPGRQARMVSEYMSNVAVLRELRAFRRFESDVQEVLARVVEERRHG
jgi:hypothetical protein